MNLFLFCVLFALICVAWSVSVSIPESVDSDIELESASLIYNVRTGSSNSKGSKSKKSPPNCSNHGTLLDKVACSCFPVDNKCNSTATFDKRAQGLNQNLDSYLGGTDTGLSTLTGQVNINCNGITSVTDQTTIEGALCALGCICAKST